MPKFIFRIDDVCPEMDWEKFNRLVNLFKRFKIKPLLAVVPDNQDEVLKKEKPNTQFWERINELVNNGFVIGMHGYQHKYVNKSSGLLKIFHGSEFAGLPYNIQLGKIKKGKEIFKKNGMRTDIFIAPGHSFDKNTIKALKTERFKYISDGIALWPFEKYKMIWIPQIAWNFHKIPFGIITFCLHPNNFSEKDFLKIEKFIQENRKEIIDFWWAINWFKNQDKIKKALFCLIDICFKIVWRIRFNIFKLIQRNQNANYKFKS